MNSFATVIVSPNPPDPAAPYLGTCHLGITVHGESVADTLRRLADAIDDHSAGLDTDEDPEQAQRDVDDERHLNGATSFSA